MLLRLLRAGCPTDAIYAVLREIDIASPVAAHPDQNMLYALDESLPRLDIASVSLLIHRAPAAGARRDRVDSR